MAHLALAGSLSVDRVAGGPPRAGGMPTWAVPALRALGIEPQVLVKCAPADRARLAGPLGGAAWIEASETTAFSFSYRGDRRLMEVDAVGDPWRAEELDGLAAGWVHLGALLRGDFDARAVAAAAAGGRQVSLDGQGLARRRATGPLALDEHYDPGVLRHVRVLKLAAEEAEALLGSVTVASLASLDVPEIVVTYGSEGSRVFADGVVADVPADAVAAEPTGAGDAFAAVYAASRATGHAPVAAARRATSAVRALLSRDAP